MVLPVTFISVGYIVLQFMSYFLLETKKRFYLHMNNVVIPEDFRKIQIYSVLLTNELEDLNYFRYIPIVKASFLRLHG